MNAILQPQLPQLVKGSFLLVACKHNYNNNIIITMTIKTSRVTAYDNAPFKFYTPISLLLLRDPGKRQPGEKQTIYHTYSVNPEKKR